MLRALSLLLATGVLAAAEAPLFVFDNGVGRGVLPLEEQVKLAGRTGYAGILYSGTQEIPRLVAAHRDRGLKILGIYTGMNLDAATPGYDPGLPEAIRQLRGTGALIAFTVSGKGSDEQAAPVVREVAAMAEEAGLNVALYPHYGFHVARIEDALRLREKAGRTNVGVIFNLCHWLRSGDEAHLTERLAAAMPHLMLVSINGADPQGDWDRLIQPLDQGEFDVQRFVGAVRAAGYKGPLGLQCFQVKGDREENLQRSMRAWRGFLRE